MPESRCRITVLIRSFNKDLYFQYPSGAPEVCGRLVEGQQFVTENRWDPPEGLCTWAWADMRPIIHAIHGGDTTVRIFSCSDGLRPVLFKLERVEE
jgi:uncharacterized repeat protein (TIGR04076 family)